MKKLLSVLLVLLSIQFSIAQEFKFESGKINEKPHENSVTKIAFATAYGFTTYSYLENVFLDNEKEITITKYDQKLNAFETKRFNLPKLDLRAADLNKVIELETKLIFISNSMSKKKSIREIYAQVYDNASGIVSESKIIASYTIDGYSKSGQIEVNVSDNKETIAIFANMPFVKKTQEKIKAWTFNNNLEKLWESTQTLNLSSERGYNQDLHVSNNGTIYVIKRHKYNSKKATSSLITISKSGLEETLISEPNFFLRNTTLLNAGAEDFITGFYSEEKVPYIDNRSADGNTASGVFLYNPQTKTIIGKHAFDTKNSIAKKLASVVPIHTSIIGDNIYIVGEKQTYTSKFKSEKSTDLDYLYTHGPTVVVNLDTAGTLKDMSYLDNSATYKNAQNERASVAVLPLNSGLKLFYNKSNFTIASFYNSDKTTYSGLENKNEAETSKITSYLVPKSLASVKDFNIIYFVSTNGNNYWLNKMIWE